MICYYFLEGSRYVKCQLNIPFLMSDLHGMDARSIPRPNEAGKLRRLQDRIRLNTRGVLSLAS